MSEAFIVPFERYFTGLEHHHSSIFTPAIKAVHNKTAHPAGRGAHYSAELVDTWIGLCAIAHPH